MLVPDAVPITLPLKRTAVILPMTQAARVLNINPRTLRLAVERGQIEARHPLPDGPWVINRRALQALAAADLVQRGNRTGAIPNDEQETFDFATT